MRRMRVGSLFSGIGGFDLAFDVIDYLAKRIGEAEG